MNTTKYINDLEIIDIFSQIAGYKKHGLEARHKVLLVLYMLGRYWQCKDREVTFEEAFPEVNKLINLYSPKNSKKDIAAYYPFWHLQNNKPKIWNLYGVETLKKSTDGRPLMSAVKKNKLYRGGIIEPIYQRIVHDKYFLLNLVFIILNQYFPKAIHFMILESIGIPSSDYVHIHNKEDVFNTKVLANYDYSCVACARKTNKTKDDITSIQAAHIKWPLVGGPDDEDNGIALCPQHKLLFNHGAFSLNEDQQFIVSKSSVVEKNNPLLIKLANKTLPEPVDKILVPNKEYIQWHNTAVFK